MSVIAKWRNKTWEVNNSTVKAIKDLSFAYEQQADNNSSTKEKSPTNERSTQLFQLSFNTLLHSAAGIEVRKEIAEWKALVTTTGYFYLSGQQLGPKLQLRKVSVDGTEIDNFGRMLLATLSFEFKEYDASTSSVPETATSALNLTASSSDKEDLVQANHAVGNAGTTGITVGSYVYPTGTKYYTGQTIPNWVKQRSHKVSRINGPKTLLGHPDGINGWVYTNELSLA
jgi:hypothetical protein